jgi:anti-anti-sigma factor
MDSEEVLVEVAFVDGWTVAQLRGEIDADKAPALLMTLDQLLDRTMPARLDLSGVTFLDSSGLRVLILQYMRFDEAGGRLEISATSSIVSRVLDVGGVAHLFQPDTG